MEKRRYNVAGHVFEAAIAGRIARNYEPFLYSGPEEPLFSLDITKSEDLAAVLGDAELVLRCNEEPPYLWIYRSDSPESGVDPVSVGFSLGGESPVGVLRMRMDGPSNCLYLAAGIPASEAETAVGNAVMLLYTRYVSSRDTLLIHSSTVVDRDGYGYAFLGKSGTGKSTHSRLWMENIGGTWLLNDDNPVVRVLEDGSVRIYGTPWSGKTPCYKNDSAPLRAIVDLEQAPFNGISRLPLLSSYMAFLPACSCIRWLPEGEEGVSRTVEKTVGIVACYHLKCLPDADAAFVCNKEVCK
ncbi:MAG: hypothetical protein MJY56_04275 [Bacteroidales bacterium]|nr:hypothetical protein [Bacteroidales bacterium]